MNSKEINPKLTWLEACDMAVETVMKFEGANIISDELGEIDRRTYQWVSTRTVSNWFCDFRNNGYCFLNYPKRKSLIDNTPPIFDINPSLKSDFIEYAKTNIAQLSGELMYQYVHSTLIPKLIAQEEEDTGEPVLKDDIMKEYGLSSLSLATVYRWMSWLGFNYCPIKKTFYVDGHEHPDTVQYRKKYVKEYLDLELRCFRWIQLTLQEVEELEKENSTFVRNKAYVYKDESTDVTMYEFHVDDVDNDHRKINSTPYGGNLSVRKKKEDKPVIMIGQDECVFKQYLIVKKQWILHDGTSAVNPKEEGAGVMLSSFVSQDFGYGYNLTDDELAIVNRYRLGKTYKDEDAAMEVLKSIHKKPLQNSPFVRRFEYRINSQGYWDYNHMILQFEDVVDTLQALYGDAFHFVFFFDHSAGHDKLRPNGLNVNTMNKFFGGGQNEMRDSKIEDETYLGPYCHNQCLNVGDTQHMQFKEGDVGPFYLDSETREECKYDRETGEMEEKTYTRSQLIDMIKEKQNVPYVRGNLKEIQRQACILHIPLSYNRPVIVEGWVNKPKGMLQVLWERGFIDVNKGVRFYIVDSRRENKHNKEIIPGTSLKQMVLRLPYFGNEVTLLQFRAIQLGVEVRCSPKYHPEIAGEAVEYCWAYSKNTYRRYKLQDKKNKEKFMELVNECQKGITKYMVRTYGRRIRRYIVAYSALADIKQEQGLHYNSITNTQNEIINVPDMSCSLLEKMVKQKKSHRNIADGERKFLNYVQIKIEKASKELGT